MEAFSDAQLCSGKNKCLLCSNPRLHEQKRVEGLEQQPLSDLGRSRSCGARKPRVDDDDSLHECSGCRKLLPRKQFSKRQLSQGHGRCHACAAKACAVNVAKQARKRPVDEMLDDDDDSDNDSDDERYKASLLRGVEEARRSSGSCSAGTASSSANLTMPIDASNPGHRMLQKLGWVPGDGLGLQGQGDLDPPALVSRQGRAGLGDTGDHDERASRSEPADSSTSVLPGSARPADWLRWVEDS